MEELVKAGSEIEQADKFGMTAMDYAKNSKEITEVLKNLLQKRGNGYKIGGIARE